MQDFISTLTKQAFMSPYCSWTAHMVNALKHFCNYLIACCDRAYMRKAADRLGAVIRSSAGKQGLSVGMTICQNACVYK